MTTDILKEITQQQAQEIAQKIDSEILSGLPPVPVGWKPQRPSWWRRLQCWWRRHWRLHLYWEREDED